MPKVEWHGEQLAAEVQDKLIELARMTAEEILGKAVNLAPLNMDTPAGTLRNSGTVTDLETGASISFNTPYAVVMHEWEGYKPSHAGTGPGYLRKPVLAAEDQYHKDVEDALRSLCR